ncbi:MAG: hypothetical protein FRX48_02085 [Lasallia pustulata]|uniref:Uncharacterized protein n=1 Tax=Lasallia pustulata TaxID=136370 RepID=A0A5M8PXA7_9LECA|nr:MAG: hypothetical protein FRX48_02085 [Lasallia pustulata]
MVFYWVKNTTFTAPGIMEMGQIRHLKPPSDILYFLLFSIGPFHMRTYRNTGSSSRQSQTVDLYPGHLPLQTMFLLVINAASSLDTRTTLNGASLSKAGTPMVCIKRDE